MTDGRPRIYLFPGLACDERIIEPQRGIAADVVPLSYLPPIPSESLKDYALRYAPLIDRRTPFYLGGISFGGMLAQELAPLVKPRGLILIACCRSKLGVPWLHRLLAAVAGRMPDPIVNAAKVGLPQLRRLFGIEAGWQVALFKAMLRDASPDLIRWSLRVLATWPGVNVELTLPIVQIHAARDWILPLRRAGEVDVIIPKAGHAVNVSHADEVNRAVSKWLGRVGESPIDSRDRCA